MSNFMNTSSSSSSNYGTNGGVLELTLKETLAVIKPTEEDVTARTRVIDELQAIVNQSAVPYSSATVNPFGSYICNLYTRWGDLDISIQIQDPLRRSTALKHLREAVTRRNTFRNARIPLLVVESNNHNNITCDISINNYAGVFKSIFLGWEWAKSEGINNSRDGTFTSYALSLLVIFHFQTCEPPVLPPLKELHTGEIVAGRRFLSFDLQDLRNQMTANVEKFKRERLTNTISLSELFVSFFQKFSTIEMEKDTYLCTYTGKWEQSRGGFLSLSERSMLHIEDPFARLENAAWGVYDTRKISEAFQKTYSMLISASGRDRFSLITNLVRPEIRSQIITRG
ncbi:hypothetical protein MKX03_020664 [Papaver bracteatum]|nr:hypothetical protein MKX03_020664 [Papaver bracteatum]